MTKEEKEQLLENDLFMDKEQFKELYHDVYTNKMNNAYLEHELEIYKKALYLMAKDYCNDDEFKTISFDKLIIAYINEAKEEIEND